MKKQLLLVILAVSIIWVAFATSTRLISSPQSAGLPVHRFPSVEDGKLSMFAYSDSSFLEEFTIARSVKQVLDFEPTKRNLMYLGNATAGGATGKNSLWLADITGNQTTHLMDGVIDAHFSPISETVLVWTDNHEINLVDGSGYVVQKIGTHGAAPIFSPDGRFVAFQKLGNESPDGDIQTLFENSPGIAVYDLYTGKESLVTTSQRGNDFAPVSFTYDNSTLYFNSTRTGIASLWSVKLDGSEPKQLTNINPDPIIPIPNQHTLWTSDGTKALFTTDGELWEYIITDGRILAIRMGYGDAVFWLELNKTVVVDSQTGWKVLTIR